MRTAPEGAVFFGPASNRVVVVNARIIGHPGTPVGASLLAMKSTHSTPMQAKPPLSRAGSLPQWIWGVLETCGWREPCGSGLAREGVSWSSIWASRPTAIASRLAPTV